MPNIVLIGFMGSGKSTIARLIAKESQRYFLDTDSLIESAYGKSIREIFTAFGEARFRSQEKELISWLAENVKNAVIATGGGMPIHNDVSRLGKVFYLKIDFGEISKRISLDPHQNTRPLFGNPDKVKELYDLRLKYYENAANHVIECDTKNAEQITKEILSKTSQ